MPNPSSSRAADRTDAEVGARIAARRAALGLTQGMLAAAVGVSVQQLQKYESAQNRISASRLLAVAEALGASPADFFPPTGALPSAVPSSAAARLAEDFDRIADPALRRALSKVVSALGTVPV